jgi:hypothetical protein
VLAVAMTENKERLERTNKSRETRANLMIRHLT